MTEVVVPRGFNCTTCDRFHEYGVWVSAHSAYRLTHNCQCGAKHEVIDLVAKQIVEGKKDGQFQD